MSVPGAAVRRAAAGHVVVDDLAAPALDPADEHHLVRVRRLRDGDTVTVTDGAGAWRVTRLVLAGGRGRTGSAILEPVGAVAHETRGSAVGVAVAITKGDGPEQVVTQLTELGVARVTLLAARRSVAVWDAATAARHRDRLARTAREALGQCRGTWLPVIDGPLALEDLARREGPALALAEPGGRPLGDADPGLTTVAVGPEGGWTPEERALGLTEVALPGEVLRATTAAAVAAVVLFEAHRRRHP